MADNKTLPDSELITLLRAGNHAAYTEIYNCYHYLIICFALKKLNDKELAKDITQEVFVNLWIKRSTLNGINNLPAYLITLTKHRILDLFDHEKVKLKYANSLAEYSINYVCNTDYRIREKEFTNYVNEQINTLPEKMRRTFVLSRMQNYSNKEIAKDLNTSESNVSKHVHNALRILKEKLYTLFF